MSHAREGAYGIGNYARYVRRARTAAMLLLGRRGMFVYRAAAGCGMTWYYTRVMIADCMCGENNRGELLEISLRFWIDTIH